MNPVSLKNIKVSTIKPYTKTEHPATVEPSLFDLTSVDTYVPIVFFYKPEEGQHAGAFVNLVEKLRESLSKVLVPYFPMAWRWVKTYDSRIRELECNEEGVTFIEASIDEKLKSVIRLSDFEAVELLAGHQFVGLDPRVLFQDVETPLPSLFVQVVLNVTFCHMTADTKGMFAFMEAWSEIALHGQTSIVPIHDRSLTTSLAEFTRSIAGDTGGEDVVEPEKVNINNADIKTKSIDPGLAFHYPWETTSSKILYVRRQVIKDLKLEAELQNTEVTTLDLITAHFWRSINSFPESMDGKISSVVATVVESRTRYHDPPLPERYSGNAIVTSSTPQVAASDLAAGKSPLLAAKIVHKVVRDINSSNWRGLVSQSSVSRLVGEVKGFPELKYRTLLVNSWFRLPMYEISFGQGFRKPFFASANWTLGMMPYGIVVVHPPPPTLADRVIASVLLAITSDDATRTLFSDEQFRSFFLPFH